VLRVRSEEGDAERRRELVQQAIEIIEQGPFPSRDAALIAYRESLPAHLEVLPGRAEGGGQTVTPHHVVHRQAAIAGTDVRDARQSSDEFGRPAVQFTLTPDAARRFGDFTALHVNRLLATVVDDRVTSVARSFLVSTARDSSPGYGDNAPRVHRAFREAL
jgi:preprotein translocase subunit SecD